MEGLLKLKELNQTVLAIDDDEINLKIIEELLKEDFRVVLKTNPFSALKFLDNHDADIILLDVLMPGMNGFEFCNALKNNEKTSAIPVIFITSIPEDLGGQKGLDLGAVDYIIKPFNYSILKAKINNHLNIEINRKNLENLLEIKKGEIADIRENFIKAMSVIAEYHDNATGIHLKRTENLYRILAQYLLDKFPEKFEGYDIEQLARSATLHDIGKIGIRDEILLKPCKLNKQEFDEMKRHTIIGREIIEKTASFLGKNNFLVYAGEIAELHHERYDGSGYPYGLKGEEIPVSAQIMILVDIYDALINNRPYKKPLTHEKIAEIIIQGDESIKPQYFSPAVLDAFKNVQEEFRAITEQG